MKKLDLAVLLLPLAMVVSGCATVSEAINGDESAGADAGLDAGSADGATERRSSSDLADDEERSEADLNLILSEGYSQLYESANGLQYLDEAMLLKVESDDMQAVAESAGAYFKAMSAELETLNQNYPSLVIDNNGLPVLERKTRSAAQKDRLASLAPITGLTGVEFERTLLLTLSGAFTQMRFLAQVMQEEEKSDERRAMLADIEQNMVRLYDEVVGLLEAQYFSS